MKTERATLWVLLSVVFLWASAGTLEDLPRTVLGIRHVVDYIGGMYPPNFSILATLVGPLLETIRIAITATVLSVVVAIPLSFLAARTTTSNILVYTIIRLVIAILRAVPTFLWAILFVAMVGLGPLAGVLAIWLHCVGALGKYFSETIEAVSVEVKEVLEAMRMDGAREMEVMYYGLLPAVLPFFLGYILVYFEYSIRVGTVIGMVGAGGLGLRLTMSVRLFKRHDTLAIILIIIAIVVLVDRISWQIRKRLLV